MEKYRSASNRFWAGVIDGLVFLPVMLFDSWVNETRRPVVFLMAWLIFKSASLFLYSVLMHGFYGQTLGKKAMGIKVLDISESPVSMRQAFLRDGVLIVINTLAIIISICFVLKDSSQDSTAFQVADSVLAWASFLWLSAEILTCLTNRKRRAVHDFIAGTVVVNTKYLPTEIDEVKPAVYRTDT